MRDDILFVNVAAASNLRTKTSLDELVSKRGANQC
jgi:hypothetical protein